MKPYTEGKIPVVFDTDIGSDIDDTWALTMLLKSPELDVKLVVSDTGNTTYRAKIAAKMLEIAGRTDIPVGIGVRQSNRRGRQYEWVKNYELDSYAGTVYSDGVEALIETIMNSSDPITLICTGPVTNIAAALLREPKIAEKARFVGMHGCIRRRHMGDVIAEYNVRSDPKALQKVFAAAWDITITPLDTCSFVKLRKEKYKAVWECRDPLVQALMENYRIWLKSSSESWRKTWETESSILFDTVAVYLAFSEDLLVMEELGVKVTDDGYTVIDDEARTVRCATEWKDLSAFEDFLVERLTGRQL